MLDNWVGRIVLGGVLLLVFALQYSYWWGENGYQARQQLSHIVQVQNEQNQALSERNRILAAEVYDLKHGTEAIEEYARLDLGLIKPNETFVQMSMIKGHYQPIYLDATQQAQTSSEDDVVPTKMEPTMPIVSEEGEVIKPTSADAPPAQAAVNSTP